MKLEGRSRKSQEAHADLLLKIAQSIYIAIFLGLVAAPINALFSHYLGSAEKAKPLQEIIVGFLNWGLAVVVVLAGAAWLIAYYFESAALDTLDKYFKEDKDAEFKAKVSKKKQP